jgi:citrate synthase
VLPGYPNERTGQMTEQLLENVTNWWSTRLIEIEPGVIRIRGYEIQDLIGRVSFVEQIWLMLRGEMPTLQQARLLEAALVASVDHGPQAPSIAIARMSATCGIAINNAMASGINALGDIHGGAGQQAMEIYADVARRMQGMTTLAEAGRDAVVARLDAGGVIEGFGHRFHGTDPRAVKLLALVDEAADAGHVTGSFAAIGRAVEQALEQRKGRRIPMNIDGATAVIFSELGFAPELARGLFILSRSVGILSHAWEQMSQGGRIKGPMPPEIPYRFNGNTPRKIEERS